MSQALLPQHAHGIGSSSIFGVKHTSGAHLTLRVNSHQATNLLVMLSTFSEKLTFFQMFTTPHMYRIKSQMLKNHETCFWDFFWQSQSEIALRK